MQRREFLETSAKVAGAVALMGVGGVLNAKNSGAVELIMLNNGAKMPILGFGTSRMNGKEAQTAIANAISVGYRLIDTAQMYGNEAEVGAAVAESGIKREDLFITTKLSSNMTQSEVFKSFEVSMKKLRLDYLDLLLIHSPYNRAKEMYKAMEKLHSEGRIKSLGISNFKVSAYNDFVKSCKVIPAVNQCQTHIFHQQKLLREAMAKHGTRLESWSPFINGKNDFFNNATLKTIAQKYNKSVAQIALRFLIEQGIIAIPKTSKIERMRENIAIFDFTLNLDDTKTLMAMDTGKSQFGWDD